MLSLVVSQGSSRTENHIFIPLNWNIIKLNCLFIVSDFWVNFVFVLSHGVSGSENNGAIGQNSELLF